MDREVVEHIKGSKRKEKQARKTFTMLTIVERLAKRKLVKQQLTNFIAAWSFLTIRKIYFIAISR
jgi:hypothetical protein